MILLPMREAGAADLGDLDRLQGQQAEGWLQLKQDQKSFRAVVDPAALRPERGLERLEMRQKGVARQLEQQQRQSINLDRNLRRGAEVERPAPLPRDLESRRQLDRQRLEMRIQRETLFPSHR
ncbi:MAG: hypothetical protein LJE70_17655 [Chromatiaceae bacterium]|jgi:hypothetical protein|nr:hypothetical protein [Chromatiaceae bacterium]